MEDFQALRAQLEVQTGHPGDVAAGPGEALDQAQPYGVGFADEDNWDPGSCHLRRLRRVVSVGEDEVHSVLDQLTRSGGQDRQISLGEADANNKLLVLTVAQLQQAVPQAYRIWRGS